MRWINRIYSYIHIPGTILFLVVLYFYTTVRNRTDEKQSGKEIGEKAGSPAGSALYQARRRTMAMCNLVAFIVFTAWPCMPPRLLSDPNATGPEAQLGRMYGFVDTVHGKGGESSVWTQNKFCNQYGKSAFRFFCWGGVPKLIAYHNSSRHALLTLWLLPHDRSHDRDAALGGSAPSPAVL